MDINLKTREVLAMNYVLKGIIESQSEVDPLLKFRFLGIARSIEPVVSNFEIVRNEKIKEYGTETENGFVIQKEDTDATAKFYSDMEKIENADVEIHCEKIPSSEIFNNNIKTESLMALYPIIEG